MDRYDIVAGLEPQTVLRRFCDISTVPRASGEMKEISDYIVSYIQSLGYEAYQDTFYNVVAKIPASEGYEEAPTVMLQAHLDMVCEKMPEIEHDFSTDPIELVREGNIIRANGTTLGADDGLGVAMALGVIKEPNIRRPALEIVFTADEETDMNGAYGLDFGRLEAKYVIGLDSAAIQVCGAGEAHYRVEVPIEKTEIKEGSRCFVISVDGLPGGHSGVQAILEPGNAVAVLNRVLHMLDKKIDFQMLDIGCSGYTSTAFAREAYCVAAVLQKDFELTETLIKDFADEMKKEFAVRAPGLIITVKETEEYYGSAYVKATKDKMMNALVLIPDGLISVSREYDKTMECCANIGVLYTTDTDICFTTCIRSMISSRKYYLIDKCAVICRLLGIKGKVIRDLPQWDRHMDEMFSKRVYDVYEGYETTVSQGTVEAGIFIDNMKDISYVALGAPYYNEHSPYEFFDVNELQDAYQRLLTLLEKMK